MLDSLLILIKSQPIPPDTDRCDLLIKACDGGRVNHFEFSYYTQNDTKISTYLLYDKLFIKILRDDYKQKILTTNRWNKIHFIFKSDESCDLEIFWDETYFIEMHNVSYEEYYKEELGKL